MSDIKEDADATAFMFRMLEGETMDGAAQVFVYKRFESGEIYFDYFGMREVDLLGMAKYVEVAATLDATAALAGEDD